MWSSWHDTYPQQQIIHCFFFYHHLLYMISYYLWLDLLVRFVHILLSHHLSFIPAAAVIGGVFLCEKFWIQAEADTDAHRLLARRRTKYWLIGSEERIIFFLKGRCVCVPGCLIEIGSGIFNFFLGRQQIRKKKIFKNMLLWPRCFLDKSQSWTGQWQDGHGQGTRKIFKRGSIHSPVFDRWAEMKKTSNNDWKSAWTDQHMDKSLIYYFSEFTRIQHCRFKWFECDRQDFVRKKKTRDKVGCIIPQQTIGQVEV